MQKRAPKLVDLVRAALRRVEESADPDKDGQAVQELKSSVVLSMAEKQLQGSEDEEQAA